MGWAPYRAGRWAWVEPWGWTWIDEAPWGFAPFHYGRWALIGGVWAWVPGAFVARPVYAPALVGWIGRPGWSVSVTIGSVPAVGWFPLAPREVFVPAYRASTVYVRNVNVAHVTNVTNIVNVTNVTQTHYAYRQVDRAVTVVPAAAVSGGQPAGRSALHVRHADLVADTSAANAPPANAARPPRLFGNSRRDDDGRWTRGPQPVAAPTASAPAAPVASQPRTGGEPERRPEPRVDRNQRPVPSQPAPAAASPVRPSAVERERPGRTQVAPALASPPLPLATAPAQPRVAAPPAPRERADRHDERRPMPPAAATRAPAPMPVPPAVARAPAPAPSVAVPQPTGEQRGPRSGGNRGQEREARQGERRGG